MRRRVDRELVVEALRHLAAGDAQEALRLAYRDGGRLARALAASLRQPLPAGVYTKREAFRAFVDGGGNPALYRAVVEHVAALYRRTAPAAVLDLGCGDARVPVGAATAVDPRPRFDLVEPSGELISEAGLAVPEAGLDASLHQATA